MILLTQNGCLEVTPRWLPSSKTFFYRDFGLSHIKEEIPLEQTIKWLCKQGVWESFLLLFWFCGSLLFRIHLLRIFIHIQLQCQVEEELQVLQAIKCLWKWHKEKFLQLFLGQLTVQTTVIIATGLLHTTLQHSLWTVNLGRPCFMFHHIP